MKTFRIGQLNLNNRDQEKRLDSIAAAVSHNKLDFLMVQELQYPELLKKALEPYGYAYSEFTSYREVRGKEEFVGIISRHPLKRSNFTIDAAEEGVTFVSSELSKHEVNLISTHFTWGSNAEAQRLAQAEFIEALALQAAADSSGEFTVLAGDLNAEPDYRSVRYLSGRELNRDSTSSTLWTDAWVTAGNSDNEFTSKYSTNAQGRVTAFQSGIAYPGYLPDRRIDYIFTRGWNYGKVGCPVSFGYLSHPEGFELSDHEGIYADILLEVG